MTWPILSPNSILLFYARADTCCDPEVEARYRSVLSPAEIRKTDRYLDENARHLCLTARALVRYLISGYSGLEPDSFSFTENEHGKPSLNIPPEYTGPRHFNLSHCKGGVLCGLCLNREIGVDMEDLDRRVTPAVAARFFSPQEAAWVREKKEDAGFKERFLEIWTLKEAYIKAKGKGLAIPLDSFSFDLTGPEREIRFRDQAARQGQWQFFRWHPEPGKIAAAAVSAPRPVDIQTFRCRPFEGIYE